jgi:hypothetical protein
MSTTLISVQNSKLDENKSGELIHSKGIIDPFNNKLADSKSWPFGDMLVDSPVGILCTLKGIVGTIFLAEHAGGGYDCYVSLGYALMGGKGNTRASFVNDKPPGGLSLTLVLRTKAGGFLGEVQFARQDVGCGENGRPVVCRTDIDPNLFPLTSEAMLWLNASSWYQC